MVFKVTVDNLEMEYFKFGNGNKNMIIIPGVSIKSVMLYEDIIKEQYSIFKDEFSVYVFDRKINMEKGYSILDMAKDTIKVIDKLNLKDLYILGASQGGMIGLLIAIKRPDLVKKLNIISSNYKVNDNDYELFNNLINLSKDNKLNIMVDLFSKAAYSKSLYLRVKDNLKPFVDSINNLDIERFIIQCEALKGFNILNDLSKIEANTFIIASKLDQIFSYKDSILMNELIKNSKIYLYNEYGHDVYDEALDIKEKIYNFYIK